jgi:hypothetical protein
MREHAHQASLKQFEDALLRNPPLQVQPEFLVKFGTPGKEILHTARTLKADLVIMGLNRSRHAEVTSHMPWTTAYESCVAHTAPS